MLSIAQASGLIAAAVMIVQYGLPAALVIILVRYVGTENSAVTWSVVNRAISTTIWPHLIRADAVNSLQTTWKTRVPSWASTAGAALLVVAGVVTPLGLHDEIVLGESELIEFQYIRDPGPFGSVTMARPYAEFTRYCEFGRHINCPGQYQSVYVNETEPGVYSSVETDENSTINTTIPANFTTMFTSATSDQGNTISGLFDIQFRRWKFNKIGMINKGRPFVQGNSRFTGTLIAQDRVVLVEGLIVDMRKNPGVGFRNHTIPVGLSHGGTWKEDITWAEPVTKCADSNLSIALRSEKAEEEWDTNTTFYIVDRGAFVGLNVSALESPPWNDNQTLDLFGRAHKAARMHNVFVASSLNLTLPLDPTKDILGKMVMKDPGPASAPMYSALNFDQSMIGQLTGIGGAPPEIPEVYAYNSTTPFVNYYPDGWKKLLALNYSAITEICKGYYEIDYVDLDYRANNITYPLVSCGFVLGAPLQKRTENLTISVYTGIEEYQKNLYVCASAIRASVKTVTFLYNGTGARFENLEVVDIADKVYPNEKSKPLWAGEHSYDKAMRFDPLWGIVDDSYENYGFKEGFYTLRAEKFWLTATPTPSLSFGDTDGFDALAAVSSFPRRLANLYGFADALGGPDYSGKNDYTMLERFQSLSHNQDDAAQIPNLIMTDGFAAGLVGTKTSISTKYVQWPASLAVDDTVQGYPSARVTAYRRALRYDIRYAIPALMVLSLLLPALIWALAILVSTRHLLQTLKNLYNQTSTGRLATGILVPTPDKKEQSSRDWVKGDGSLLLSFGHIKKPEKDPFCEIVGGGSSDATQSPPNREKVVSPVDGGAQTVMVTPAGESQGV
ncbi:hypothetical protein PV08_04877 [Exophiala spinifera]|uniref:Uncharacterized protein n=1 Tax=Exophiala spinifera TaxID=91928 RepID=A0A0D1ZYF1_9EURO|nr:uncharacterized protein PV08_04877 [Exophiala spinifera]KIW17682.1 hypothetical protein PV08_04877 [Exophiala spinifera]